MTSYFSFGQNHVHRVNGKVFDKNCLVKITAADPREVMVRIFKNQWSMEYMESQLPGVEKYFLRGVIEL